MVKHDLNDFVLKNLYTIKDGISTYVIRFRYHDVIIAIYKMNETIDRIELDTYVFEEMLKTTHLSSNFSFFNIEKYRNISKNMLLLFKKILMKESGL